MDAVRNEIQELQAAFDLQEVVKRAVKYLIEGGAVAVAAYYIPKKNNHIIVDYAHTPESLESLLRLTKEIYPKTDIITLFGCGGDKSKLKRPKMGAIAEHYSNFVIVTNDNPRSENPMDVAKNIVDGIAIKDKYHVILDRSEAIKTCLSKSKNCIIVIAGKGAEDYMRIGDKEIYHNDKICLLEWCYQNNLTLINTSRREKTGEN